MKTVVSLNPFECRMWDLHDRLESYITEESCRAEIESFLKHGQLIPVLGRTLREDARYKVELVYGARRLFVARHLNTPILVELRELSDRDALIAMDIENRVRTDISPYERGRSYARWLRDGHFSCQEDIARATRVSASQVSRLLKLTELPAVVVDAFDSPKDIREGWGLEIAQALEEPTRRSAVIRVARRIAARSPRPSGREVYRQLLAGDSSGRRIKPAPHDEVVKDTLNRPLFRIRHHARTISFVLPLSRLAPGLLTQLRRSVAEILQLAEDGVSTVDTTEMQEVQISGVMNEAATAGAAMDRA